MSALRLPSARVLRFAALAAIVILAAFLRFSDLDALGYANHYYAAAVSSMLKSWHNFFFVVAEPGGSVTVDKPPLGLWIQTASAYFLGVNGFALLLPQILAGIASVIVVYHLVQRSFGAAAGLLAALALAITPVVVATDRNNTIDSTLILTLLLGAWAFIKATETGKLRILLLGAGLVGVGFNIKMLEAYLPLPAFFVMYFLGSVEGVWRKIGKLALASVLLLVISLSWAVAVDLTPADQRPYVGSSGNNSEMSLIIGYNGMERLLGMFGRRGGLGRTFGNSGFSGQAPRQSGSFPRYGVEGNNFTFPSNGGGGNAGRFPQNRAFRYDGGYPSGAPGGGFAPGFPGGGIPPQGRPSNNPGSFFGGAQRGFGGGMSGTGRAGALRLFTPPLSKEASWLLPFGLVSALLLLLGTHFQWPIASNHQALVLWGGWLLTAGIFFSIAGFFHEYYLSTLAPPLAALVGIGMILLWRLHEKLPWLAFGLILVAAGGTLGFQIFTAQAFVRNVWWLPLAIALLGAGAILLAASNLSSKLRPAGPVGYICLMAAILLTPGIWSGLTTAHSSDNQSLPSAYSGQSFGPANRGGLQVNQALLDYLEANTRDVKFLMAVPSSMQGADYVLASERPVLYLGGFMGQDQVATVEDLAGLVDQGELRYVYWEGNGRGAGNNTDISSWLVSACVVVPGFDTQTRNSGAPDGTSDGQVNPADGQNNRGFQGMGGNMQIALYDCGGPSD